MLYRSAVKRSFSDDTAAPGLATKRPRGNWYPLLKDDESVFCNDALLEREVCETLTRQYEYLTTKEDEVEKELKGWNPRNPSTMRERVDAIDGDDECVKAREELNETLQRVHTSLSNDSFLKLYEIDNLKISNFGARSQTGLPFHDHGEGRWTLIVYLTDEPLTNVSTDTHIAILGPSGLQTKFFQGVPVQSDEEAKQLAAYIEEHGITEGQQSSVNGFERKNGMFSPPILDEPHPSFQTCPGMNAGRALLQDNRVFHGYPSYKAIKSEDFLRLVVGLTPKKK